MFFLLFFSLNKTKTTVPIHLTEGFCVGDFLGNCVRTSFVEDIEPRLYNSTGSPKTFSLPKMFPNFEIAILEIEMIQNKQIPDRCSG